MDPNSSFTGSILNNNISTACEGLNLTTDYLETTTDFSIYNGSESNDTCVATLNQGNKLLAIETSFIWWQAFDAKYLLHSTLWTVVAVVSYVIILVTGLLGNSLVILAFMCRPKMRTVTHLFIMNLAVADLLAVLFCFLGNLLSNTIKPWILGATMCKAVAYVQGMSVCASAHLLAAISVDRCKAIYRPLGRPQGLRRRQAFITIILIWCLSLCLPIPWAVILTTVEQKRLTFCVEIWENELHGKIYFLCVNVFLFYVLPLIVIIVTNVIIWYKIKRREVPQAIATATAITQMHRKARHGVRKMLGIVTTVFLLSWMPLYVLVIRYRYFALSKTELQVLHTLLPFAQWLGSCNSSVNPVLYAFLNAKFREAFQSLLPSCFKFFRRAWPSTATTRTINSGMIELV